MMTLSYMFFNNVGITSIDLTVTDLPLPELPRITPEGVFKSR